VSTDVLKNMLRSATDPLKTGPNAGRELADRFGKTADGFSREHVLDATASVMLDLIRQEHGNRTAAHSKLTEFADKMHVLLDQHYDPITGKRRHVFAFDQNIAMNFTDDRKHS
jgi:CO dehydrogenase/acetyl-CoA synthase epsilon subunit